MKCNTIMDQLDKFNGNGYKRKNNMNQFAPLYESDNEKGTKKSTKPKTPIIVLSE